MRLARKLSQLPQKYGVDLEELRVRIVKTTLGMADLVVGASGNVSVRTPDDEALITPSVALGDHTERTSPEEAFKRTEILEEMAEIFYHARLAGGPISLTKTQITETKTRCAPDPDE